jgi:hypothetical protein
LESFGDWIGGIFWGLIMEQMGGFVFFSESGLKKLLKSKFSEFLSHSLYLYSILKFAIEGRKLL